MDSPVPYTCATSPNEREKPIYLSTLYEVQWPTGIDTSKPSRS